MLPPFSSLYQDVYFSAHDGLAEKRYVFLEGNNLPDRWRDRSDFMIAEFGFGTGLSFLATAKSFLSTTSSDQKLHFFSFEAHPLEVQVIEQSLSSWSSDLQNLIQDLIKVLPRRIPGIHRVILQDRVFLTLVYGDINETLPDLDLTVDAWFLDGFSPAKNPGMWSERIFTAMGRKSAIGATAATYSAARQVRDQLTRIGYQVEKKKGFGFKSDMVTARLVATSGRPILETIRHRKIAILGGGLAATAIAWAAQRMGHTAILVAPRGLADGASGNRCGLYNPRFTIENAGIARFYAAAFVRFYSFLQAHPVLSNWQPSGTLHLLRKADQAARLEAVMDVWGWGDDDAKKLSSVAATEKAGIQINHEAVWLPAGGSVAPDQVCQTYARGCEIRPDLPSSYDVLVYANGMAALQHPMLEHLPLHTVRGQISFIRSNKLSSALKTNLCYGGYLTPADSTGLHILGATFQKWLHDINLRQEDHCYVQDKLHAMIGPLFGLEDVVGGRAAFRVASIDHAPVIGRVGMFNDVPIYASLAHGSHGLLSTHLGAWHLVEKISNFPSSLDRLANQLVCPDRFQKA